MRNVASCHDLTVLDVLDVVHGSRSVKNNTVNYFCNTRRSIIYAKIKPRNKGYSLSCSLAWLHVRDEASLILELFLP